VQVETLQASFLSEKSQLLEEIQELKRRQEEMHEVYLKDLESEKERGETEREKAAEKAKTELERAITKEKERQKEEEVLLELQHNERVEKAKEEVSKIWKEEKDRMQESYEGQIKMMIEEHQQRLDSLRARPSRERFVTLPTSEVSTSHPSPSPLGVRSTLSSSFQVNLSQALSSTSFIKPDEWTKGVVRDYNS
jgi:myosin protein heavy chain